MMKATAPVDGNIRLLGVQLLCRLQAGTRVPWRTIMKTE
jgi:hypothetical protein